jgi:hypothetical protein
MIKAKYTGVDCEIQSGRVYPITTHCAGNRLVVSVRACKFEYPSLERFLKEWRVVAVGGYKDGK